MDDMNDVFFTSDLHFGHKRMAWDFRDFGTEDDIAGAVENMDQFMIERWNDTVRPGDRIYNLGDFSFHNRAKTIEILGRLNGEHHFVKGNHDSVVKLLTDHFTSFEKYKEIRVEGQQLILFHFPILSWHHVGQGSWHLHGHSHGNLHEDPEMARMDVGVDTHDFRPYSFEEIADRLRDRVGRPSDHHQ